MVSKKFDELFNKYSNATNIEDRRIRVKLKEISVCYDECSIEEQEFTSEIIDKFCELIELIEDRNEEERQTLIFKYEDPNNVPNGSNFKNFVDYRSGCVFAKEEHISYQTADELLVAFYNYFRNEQKKKSEKEKIDHPPIEKLDNLKEGARVNSTMKDYLARLKTFANSYMYDIPRINELWCSEPEKTDTILFVYKNLELILAHFNTRDENGNVNKQKCNIQSALRKLNEFKRMNEFYR